MSCCIELMVVRVELLLYFFTFVCAWVHMWERKNHTFFCVQIHVLLCISLCYYQPNSCLQCYGVFLRACLLFEVVLPNMFVLVYSLTLCCSKFYQFYLFFSDTLEVECLSQKHCEGIIYKQFFAGQKCCIGWNYAELLENS